MHRVAPPRRSQTTFQVRPAELGCVDYPGLAVTVTLRRNRDDAMVTVETGEERWRFDDVEDGLAAPIGGEPTWMDAVLEFAGVELAR